MQLNDAGLPYPLPAEAAALAPQLRALGFAADGRIAGALDSWADLADYPASVKGHAGGQSMPITVETGVNFTATVFDNQFATFDTNDIVLPDQDQRYWWWVGIHLRLAALNVANVRIRPRIYVADRDPVTGLTPTTVITEPWYSASSGLENLMMGDLVRSGGGRIRATLQHAHSAALTVNAGSLLWAVRVASER